MKMIKINVISKTIRLIEQQKSNLKIRYFNIK